MEFSIGAFEGPLDLLLALVRKEEMDIVDIDIRLITQKYLSVIQENPSLNLNKGGEFIQMASTLMYLKSKSLLPLQEEESLENEEEGITKEDLVQALLNRNHYLKVAQKLGQRPSLNKDFWTCTHLEFIPSESDEIKVDGLFFLVQAFRKALKKATSFKMNLSFPSISEWIFKLKSFFKKGQKTSFQTVIHKLSSSSKKGQPYTYQVLLSFLSLLELGKLGVVTMEQKEQDILIHTKRDIDEGIWNLFRSKKENVHEKVG